MASVKQLMVTGALALVFGFIASPFIGDHQESSRANTLFSENLKLRKKIDELEARLTASQSRFSEIDKNFQTLAAKNGLYEFTYGRVKELDFDLVCDDYATEREVRYFDDNADDYCDNKNQ